MLPPYAREIVNTRQAGRHPDMILIAIAPREAWFKVNDHRYPFVFVPEDAYTAGRLDFWWVAGVPVTLYAESSDDATWLHLAGTLGDLTAPIAVQARALEAGIEVDAIMRAIRYGTLYAGAEWVELDPVSRWPQWWSEARDLRYGLQRDRWEREQRERGAA